MTFMKRGNLERLRWWPWTPESEIPSVPLEGTACDYQQPWADRCFVRYTGSLKRSIIVLYALLVADSSEKRHIGCICTLAQLPQRSARTQVLFWLMPFMTSRVTFLAWFMTGFVNFQWFCLRKQEWWLSLSRDKNYRKAKITFSNFKNHVSILKRCFTTLYANTHCTDRTVLHWVLKYFQNYRS